MAPYKTKAVAALSVFGRQQAAGSNALAFGQVFEEHAAYVVGLLRRLGVAEADLEDVAQETFVTIHAKLPEFEGRSSLKTWVCGICLRKASSYRRQAVHRREVALIDRREPEAPDDPHRGLQEKQWAQQLQAALDSLPEAQKRVFVLYEIEELSMTEVARALGCPLFTAYTRLRAARKAVRTRFAASDAGSGSNT